MTTGKKRDTGYDHVLKIPEEQRDALAKIDFSKPRRDPSANPENWTTRDFEEHNWSGLRHNLMVDQIEVWVVGKIKGSIPSREAALYPERLSELLSAVFRTPIVIEMDISDAVGVAESQSKIRAQEGKKTS